MTDNLTFNLFLQNGSNKNKGSILDDDLDDLINDIDGAGTGDSGGTSNIKKKPSGYNYEIPAQKLANVQNISLGGKCYPLYMGGSSLIDGQTLNSLNPKSCDKLRCYNCDKKVHRFMNS